MLSKVLNHSRPLTGRETAIIMIMTLFLSVTVPVTILLSVLLN